MMLIDDFNILFGNRTRIEVQIQEVVELGEVIVREIGMRQEEVDLDHYQFKEETKEISKVDQ